LIGPGLLAKQQRDRCRIIGSALRSGNDRVDQVVHRVIFKQRHNAHETFAGTSRVVFNITVEQRLQRVVEASVTKDFGTHNRTVLECEQVDKMKRVQNRFVFAKDALWFGDKHAVNDNANAIVKDLDDRIAMCEL
jgi:hypothetical protein